MSMYHWKNRSRQCESQRHRKKAGCVSDVTTGLQPGPGTRWIHGEEGFARILKDAAEQSRQPGASGKEVVCLLPDVTRARIL